MGEYTVLHWRGSKEEGGKISKVVFRKGTQMLDLEGMVDSRMLVGGFEHPWCSAT